MHPFTDETRTNLSNVLNQSVLISVSSRECSPEHWKGRCPHIKPALAHWCQKTLSPLPGGIAHPVFHLTEFKKYIRTLKNPAERMEQKTKLKVIRRSSKSIRTMHRGSSYLS